MYETFHINSTPSEATADLNLQPFLCLKFSIFIFMSLRVLINKLKHGTKFRSSSQKQYAFEVNKCFSDQSYGLLYYVAAKFQQFLPKCR